MNTVHTTEDEDLKYRQRVVAGMQSESFSHFFHGEFENLRKAISEGDKAEIQATIESLESCGVNLCQQFDEIWERCNENKH